MRSLKSDAMVSAVAKQHKIRLSLSTDQRAGDRVLEVRELSKSFDSKTLWKDVRFEIKRGERIGIIGPNGSGKTTLLRALMGQEETDSGVIRWGANLGIGYYDQRLDEFDPDRSIIWRNSHSSASTSVPRIQRWTIARSSGCGPLGSKDLT